MDAEDVLGWLMAVCLFGAFAYLVFVAWTKERALTIAEFRKSPIAMSLTWLAVIGILTFLLWIVSLGKLAFVVHTPWLNIHSGLAGLVMGFLVFFVRKR